MARAFLSHSSVQKSYVTEIADELGSSAILDSRSFEEGLKNIEEIFTTLGSTDLFVLLISNESLDSEWVKKEILYAKDKLDDNIIKRIFPIIIDKNITFSDSRIPEWLRKEYNLKPILRKGKLLKSIKTRLKEIIWEKHPNMKLRDQLFVGRNLELNKFEERIDDIQKNQPIIVFTSGFSKIGKRSFMKKALLKANVIFKESYDFPVINLNARESIEDFILKVYDLGLSEKRAFPNFLEISIDEKVDIALALLKDCQSMNEIILVEDNGSLVTPENIIAPWLLKLLKTAYRKGLHDKITMCVSSQFRLKRHTVLNYDEIFSLDLQELGQKEKTGLLKRSAGIYNIEFSNDELQFFAESLIGFPEQIFFCVNYIESTSVKEAMNNISTIQDYQKDKFAKMVEEMHSSPYIEQLLTILAEFDFISLNLLHEVVPNSELLKIIQDLNGRSIVEYIGSDKEYLRLNEGIKDFLLRGNFTIDSITKDKLKKHIEKFVEEDDMIENDISDFFYSLKGALQNNYRFQSKLLLPSHYLKTMIFLYEKEKDYKKVIVLADRVLEKQSKIDISLLREIKYWLCLALAREEDERFKTEVQYFSDTPDYHFLFGFFYRMTSKPEFALDQYNAALEKRPNFSRAQRELVQVLLNLELFEKAYSQAKFNYENHKDNPYHIQAYFDCLVRKSPKENEGILLQLIDELRKLSNDKAKEMVQLAEADYHFYVRENVPKSLQLIDQAIADYGLKNFSLRRKFNILLKSGHIEQMEDVIRQYESKFSAHNFHERSILSVMKIKLTARQGHKDEALRQINTKLRHFSEDYREYLYKLIENI